MAALARCSFGRLQTKCSLITSLRCSNLPKRSQMVKPILSLGRCVPSFFIRLLILTKWDDYAVLCNIIGVFGTKCAFLSRFFFEFRFCCLSKCLAL